MTSLLGSVLSKARKLTMQKIVSAPPWQALSVVVDVPKYAEFVPYCSESAWIDTSCPTFKPIPSPAVGDFPNPPNTQIFQGHAKLGVGFQLMDTTVEQTVLLWLPHAPGIDLPTDSGDRLAKADILATIPPSAWCSTAQVVSYALPNPYVETLQYLWTVEPFPPVRTPVRDDISITMTRLRLEVQFVMKTPSHAQLWDMASDQVIDRMLTCFVNRMQSLS